MAEKAVQKGKQYYMRNLYGKTVFSPALQENIKFTARGLLYLRRKGSIEDQARRFKLLPRVLPIVENVKHIDPQDIHKIDKNHYRYGLLGRFKDGSVVRGVFDEIQREGKKFFSVFDIEDLRGEKLVRKLGHPTPGGVPGIRGGVAAPGKPTAAAKKTISPPSREVKPPKKGGPGTTADTGQYAKTPTQAIELPEIVEIAKRLMQGKYPKIRRKLRAMMGMAVGVFKLKGSGEIQPKADIFRDTGKAARFSPHQRSGASEESGPQLS